MSITVHIPRELRAHCGGTSQVLVTSETVAAVLEELEQRYPNLHRLLCDESGRLRRHINLFVNATHMRERNGLETALVSGDSVFILPAVSGG